MIPISGSAYSYTYATVGEFVAWIIGWDLCLEYLVGAAAVAVGWSYYLEKFLYLASGHKITFDPNLVNAPVLWDEASHSFIVTGYYFNVPAFLGTVLLTILLAYGIKQSTWVVSIMVGIKVVVILMFIFGGIKYSNTANLQPFTPYGFDGIFRASIIVFFAYIGFDAVSTTAQEAQNPQRDMPIGIIGSLSICTVLYVAVCIVLCCLSPYTDIPKDAPVAAAFVNAGGPEWVGTLLAFGALTGLTSVLMVTLIGQPRIFRAMAYDGLFPQVFAYISPKTGTPVVTTLFSGFLAAVLAGCFPIDVLAELSSVGTLFAFFLVSAAVVILRYREPE
ncbi:Cationic amino acid transporter-1, partial [Phlyctochytrium bullatum]